MARRDIWLVAFELNGCLKAWVESTKKAAETAIADVNSYGGKPLGKAHIFKLSLVKDKLFSERKNGH